MNRYYLLIVLISVLLLSSCYSNKVTIEPNYNNEYYNKPELKKTNLKIINAFDIRFDVDKYYTGTTQGENRRKAVSYYLSKPVTKFVKSSINQIINADSSKQTTPVIIYIDDFNAYEQKTGNLYKNYFRCALNFIYTISSDSVCIINTFVFDSSEVNKQKTSFETMIYKGIEKSTEQFINKYNSNEKSILRTNNTNIFSDEIKIPDSLKNQEYITSKQDSHLKSTFMLSGQRSENISSGFSLGFASYRYNANSRFNSGLGIEASIYNISNPENNRFGNQRGTYIDLGAKGAFRYFLNKGMDGLYFVGNIKFSIGYGSINSEIYTNNNFGSDGSDDNISFVYGFSLEEGIGIKIGKIILETKCYQLGYNAHYLSDDIGLKISLGLQFD